MVCRWAARAALRLGVVARAALGLGLNAAAPGAPVLGAPIIEAAPVGAPVPDPVVLQEIGFFGFVAMMVFLGILVVGFIYEWKKGALEWE